MYYRKNINRKLWLPYLKTYEDFNKTIPEELKKLFSEIKLIIGDRSNSFKKSIDLNDLNFCDTIINIDVDFNPLKSGQPYHKKDIIYYSNININDLLENKHIIDIPIRIDDINMNMNKLISVISHEIRHIYDIYTINEESDMDSFVKSYYYGNLSTLENNNDFKYFLFLVYLSLEHELIARNTMIWEMFIDCHCSKEELIKLYQESSIYDSFTKLNNFDYRDLLKIPDILDKVNEFIKFFGVDKCYNIEDVELFFKNWKIYFENKSKEYLDESYKVLDDVFNLINENKSNKKIINVKDLLFDIYIKHIKIK